MIDPVHMILDIMGRKPRIELHPEMPTGPLNRVAAIPWAKSSSAGNPRSASLKGFAGPSTGTLPPGTSKTLLSLSTAFLLKGTKGRPFSNS